MNQNININDPKAFIEYSNDMRDVYKNINWYDSWQKLNSIVTELFIIGRKLNISLVFITQSYLEFKKMLDWMLLTFLSQKS